METVQIVIYLILGLGLTGGIFYALAQMAGRQRRLHAELTRLEQLTAEVAMTAEAMLDKIDERIDRLNRIAAQVEGKVEAARAVPANAAKEAYATAAKTAAPAAPVQGSAGAPAPRKRGRPRKHPLPAEQPVSAPQPVAAPQPPDQAAAAAQQPAPPQPPAESQPESQPADGAPRSAKVHAVQGLAAEGKSIAEIAEALDIPRGEVQLILNLWKVTA